MECIVDCLYHGQCKSININTKKRLCELLDDSFTENPNALHDSVTDDWVHYESSKSELSSCSTPVTVNDGPRQYQVCCKPRRFGGSCQDVEGTHQSKPAHSCKSIKSSDPSLASGIYWIDLLDESSPVYCDMETDGGGWTLIGNLTLNETSDRELYYFGANNERDIKKIGNAVHGRFLLNGESFAGLQQQIQFASFRLYCRKEHTGTTMHLIISDTGRMEYLTGVSDTVITGCQSVRFLGDDDSHLQSSGVCHCSKARDLRERLYNHLIYTAGKFHINLYSSKRMECDNVGEGTNGNDKWSFYVR